MELFRDDDSEIDSSFDGFEAETDDDENEDEYNNTVHWVLIKHYLEKKFIVVWTTTRNENRETWISTSIFVLQYHALYSSFVLINT